MFYRPGTDPHGLPHDPFKALVAPRPIGWISSLDENGIANLAPYSFFNGVCGTPPMVMFASNGSRDSIANVRATGEFVVNVCSEEQIGPMHLSSKPVPAEVDEFDIAGVEKLPSETVSPPRVAGAPAHLECSLYQIMDLPGDGNALAVGTVTGIHIDPRHLKDGKFDPVSARLLARLGYLDYATTERTFPVDRRDYW